MPPPGTGQGNTPPDAVLWDMDGTLVDTEPYWIDAEHALVTRHGGTWTDAHALNIVGTALIDAARYIREHSGIQIEPAEIVEQLLDDVVQRVEEKVPWRPGARELLDALRRDGVRCALVTMSYRRFVQPVLDALPDDTFEVVVTGDSVNQGKPHPEPYAKAARLLRVHPSRCLAIEDSNTGARSAESAGCTVLVVAHHVPVLEGERRVIIDTLVGLTPGELPVPIAAAGS